MTRYALRDMASEEHDHDHRKDRLIDFYYGREGATALNTLLTRNRIHWICSKVRGRDVLDIGCSGGLVSILLGREGLNVTGIDNFMEAVDEATKELEGEDPTVQERVRFMWAQGAELPFPDASFDTVVMGEIIEHVVLPERVLAEARRVMRPNGTLVLSTPYGRDETPDHKAPVYLQGLDELVSKHFDVESVEPINHWIGLIARAGGGRGADVDRQLLATAEARLKALEQDFRDKVKELRTAIDSLVARFETSQENLRGQRAELAAEKERSREARLKYQQLRSKKIVRVAVKLGSIARLGRRKRS